MLHNIAGTHHADGIKKKTKQNKTKTTCNNYLFSSTHFGKENLRNKTLINIEGRLAEIKTLTLEKIGQRKPLLKSSPLRTTDNILHEMINQYAWHRSALNIWPLNVRLAARIKAACKRKQQLPTLLRQQCWKLLRAGWQWYANGCNNSQQCCDLQCIVGRIQPMSLCKPCVMSVGPNNVGRAVQTDPTLLRYASAITEQKKCWELLAEKFDWFQTLRNNTQQHATGCANGRNM